MPLSTPAPVLSTPSFAMNLWGRRYDVIERAARPRALKE
jgi:hypothetical protein